MQHDRFHFDAMRTATQDLPVGGTEWIEGMSVRLRNSFDQAETFGINRIIETLKELMPHEPWKAIPKDKPCNRADVYFEGVTGKPWKVLLAMVQEFDNELACEIQANVNPGVRGGNNNPLGVNGSTVNKVVNHNNVMIDQKNDALGHVVQGNSNAYTLNKLKKDFPEYFEKVKKKEMSANAAAIEVGIRKRTIQVRPEPEAVQKALDKHMPGWAVSNKNEKDEETIKRLLKKLDYSSLIAVHAEVEMLLKMNNPE